MESTTLILNETPESYRAKRLAARRRRHTAVFLWFLLFSALAVFFLSNFQVAVVHGKSMEPTLREGNMVLLTRAYWLFGSPEVDDIVVLNHNGSLIVKRLAQKRQMPDGEEGYYVLGDNASVSEDSRWFGVVPESELVGKLVYQPQQEAAN